MIDFRILTDETRSHKVRAVSFTVPGKVNFTVRHQTLELAFRHYDDETDLHRFFSREYLAKLPMLVLAGQFPLKDTVKHGSQTGKEVEVPRFALSLAYAIRFGKDPAGNDPSWTDERIMDALSGKRTDDNRSY